MAKKNLGGRPTGSKDKKPRKRRGANKSPDPWKKKTKRKSPTNKRLLLDQLKKYNFNVVQEILWLYDQLKAQSTVLKYIEESEEIEIKLYTKDITAQMLDVLKLLVSHSYPKMKALELSTSHDNPITLNFNLGEPQEKQKPKKVQEEKKPEAIDMVTGPGGIHLPVPTKKKDG